MSPTWEDAIEKLESGCKYSFPKPIMENENALIGRDGEVDRMARTVVTHGLVVVHGSSGVGKTSLLLSGLRKRLVSKSCSVGVIREWDTIEAEEDVEKLLKEAVKWEIADGPIRAEKNRNPSLIEAAETQRRDRGITTVFILDQFEELLRQGPEVGSWVVEWAEKAARVLGIHVVISLRSDSIHLLDPLLREDEQPRGWKAPLDPRQRARHRLLPLRNADSVKTIAENGNLCKNVVKVICEAWEKVGDGPAVPTLLELQGTLWDAWYRCRETDGSQQCSDDGSGICGENGTGPACTPAGNEARELFRNGLGRAVARKMEHIRCAAVDAKIDAFHLEGAMAMIRRAARQLSTGEFKVPIREDELTRRVLQGELAALREGLIEEARKQNAPAPTDAIADCLKVFQDLRSKLSLTVSDNFDTPAILTAQISTAREPRWSASVRDATAGVMMGRSAIETLFELCRCVVLAVHWLDQSGIVRREVNSMLSLVHDGVGPPLVAWADEEEKNDRRKAAWARRRLVAADGEIFEWTESESDPPMTPGLVMFATEQDSKDPQVVVNLRWRNSRITGRFEKVVFLNCDFSGTRFVRCSFYGVTFVNCLLDDANFEQCVIVGSNELPDGLVDSNEHPGELVDQEFAVDDKTRLAPSFTIRHDSEIAVFSGFNALTTNEVPKKQQFLSDTSGRPAILGESFDQGDAGRRRTFDLHSTKDAGLLATGGVAILGGRVSFLTVFECADDGQDPIGEFTMREVAGNGVDLVLRGDGILKVSLSNASIRGLSVSATPSVQSGEAGVGPQPSSNEPSPLTLKIERSTVHGLHVGDGVEGQVKIYDTELIFADVVASAVEVDISESLYFGVLGVMESGSRNLPWGSPANMNVTDPKVRRWRRTGRPSWLVPVTDAERERFAAVLANMDYRADPASWEEEKRKQFEKESPGSRPDLGNGTAAPEVPT